MPAVESDLPWSVNIVGSHWASPCSNKKEAKARMRTTRTLPSLSNALKVSTADTEVVVELVSEASWYTGLASERSFARSHQTTVAAKAIPP